MGKVRPKPQLLERSAREEVSLHYIVAYYSSLIIFSTNLPDDVFEAGEVKPTRPLKKAVAMKRNASSEVCRAKWWMANAATIAGISKIIHLTFKEAVY